jgi:hypothetical protein
MLRLHHLELEFPFTHLGVYIPLYRQIICKNPLIQATATSSADSYAEIDSICKSTKIETSIFSTDTEASEPNPNLDCFFMPNHARLLLKDKVIHGFNSKGIQLLSWDLSKLDYRFPSDLNCVTLYHNIFEIIFPLEWLHQIFSVSGDLQLLEFYHQMIPGDSLDQALPASHPNSFTSLTSLLWSEIFSPDSPIGNQPLLNPMIESAMLQNYQQFTQSSVLQTAKSFKPFDSPDSSNQTNLSYTGDIRGLLKSTVESLIPLAMAEILTSIPDSVPRPFLEPMEFWINILTTFSAEILHINLRLVYSDEVFMEFEIFDPINPSKILNLITVEQRQYFPSSQGWAYQPIRSNPMRSQIFIAETFDFSSIQFLRTLFHEFGHILNFHLASDDIPLELRDVVELPAILLESVVEIYHCQSDTGFVAVDLLGDICVHFDCSQIIESEELKDFIFERILSGKPKGSSYYTGRQEDINTAYMPYLIDKFIAAQILYEATSSRDILMIMGDTPRQLEKVLKGPLDFKHLLKLRAGKIETFPHWLQTLSNKGTASISLKPMASSEKMSMRFEIEQRLKEFQRFPNHYSPSLLIPETSAISNALWNLLKFHDRYPAPKKSTHPVVTASEKAILLRILDSIKSHILAEFDRSGLTFKPNLAGVPFLGFWLQPIIGSKLGWKISRRHTLIGDTKINVLKVVQENSGKEVNFLIDEAGFFNQATEIADDIWMFPSGCLVVSISVMIDHVMEAMKEYSNTEFYSKFPDYRGFPFSAIGACAVTRLGNEEQLVKQLIPQVKVRMFLRAFGIGSCQEIDRLLRMYAENLDGGIKELIEKLREHSN